MEDVDPIALELIGHIFPFKVLEGRERRELVSQCRVRHVQAKETIFLEGDQGESGYLILSGRVAMLKGSMNGREMIMELLPRGELFGIITLMENKPYPLSARAQTDSSVLAIPRAAFSRMAERYPQLLQGLFGVVATRLQSAHNVSRALAHDRVEVRIASTLCALIERSDDREQSEIEIGRQELADLTGTTIETASRVCKAMERDGVLDLSRTGVIKIFSGEKLHQISLGNC